MNDGVRDLERKQRNDWGKSFIEMIVFIKLNSINKNSICSLTFKMIK